MATTVLQLRAIYTIAWLCWYTGLLPHYMPLLIYHSSRVESSKLSIASIYDSVNKVLDNKINI